jgi:pimeloyl-ACP methyl ester carboxylesterase
MSFLNVPGARLYYETRGAGPLLLLIGSPMDSTGFAALAAEMSADHTAVSYDPRGIGRSTRTDADADITPELQANDVHRLIAALGGGPVDFFGSSGGAVVGLALVTAHPSDVRTLVAHEPPVFAALADEAYRAEQVIVMRRIYETYRTDGWAAAMQMFLAEIGIDRWEPSPEQLAAMEATNKVFFGHLFRQTTAFEPDVPALRAAGTRIVLGVGITSKGQLAHRTGVAMAELLDTEPVEFPGDHGGFGGEAAAFARTLRGVLPQA